MTSALFDHFLEETQASSFYKKALLLSQVTLLALIWAPLPIPKVVVDTKPIEKPKPIPLPPWQPLTVTTVETIEKRTVPGPNWDESAPIIPTPHIEASAAPAVLDMDWGADFTEPMVPGPLDIATPELVPPKILHRVQPLYPKMAANIGMQGSVILEAVLRRDGSVSDIRVLDTIGQGKFGFEDAAIDALKQWRFQPGRLRDQAVDVRMRLKIEFSLQR